MATNDSDFAPPLSALSVQNPVTATTSSSVTTTTLINGVTGRVSAVDVPVSGSGYTVSHLGTGQYQITFTTPFVAAPLLFLTSVAGATNQFGFTTTTTQAEVAVFNTITGAGIDSVFDFLAIAVQ